MTKWTNKQYLLLATLILCIPFLYGCPGTFTKQVKQPVKEIKPSEKVEMLLAKGEKIDPEQAFEAARQSYLEGNDYFDSGKLDVAKKSYDQSLRHALAPMSKTPDEKLSSKLDSLIVEICLAQVRLARLRGGFRPLAPETTFLGIEMNADVERWLQFYLTSGRHSMEKYLTRGGRYYSLIEPILRQKNLPDDLKYLPIIESGFSNIAYSPAAAVGMWQFVDGTARRYGLTITAWMDERRDPEKATIAASSYLSDLYDQFKSWPLALAAYNCGENRVAGAISKQGHNNYWDLPLPRETCDYVPKFYAAMMIARNPELFGFFIEPDSSWDAEKIELSGVADLKALAEKTNLDYEELKELNPGLLTQYTDPSQIPYALRIPGNSAEEFKLAWESLPDEEKYISPDQVANLQPPGHRISGAIIYYTVRKGDTLSKIAKRYGTSVDHLRSCNKLGKSVRVGQRIKICGGMVKKKRSRR